MYELTTWSGQEENLPINTDSYVLNFDSMSSESSELKFADLNSGEGIDVVDVQFKGKVKKTEKPDYYFAILSGALSAAFDFLAIDRAKIEDFDLTKLDPKQKTEFVKYVLEAYRFNSEHIRSAEDRLQSFFENKTNKCVPIAVDFAKGLSAKAMLMSIVSYMLNVHLGLDEDGKLVISLMNADENVKGVTKRAQLGLLSWITGEALRYRRTGKFASDVQDVDIVKAKTSLVHLKAMIKEIADSKLFKSKSFNETELSRWCIEKISDPKNKEEMTPLQDVLVMQEIPVLFNKCLVKGYLIAKGLKELLVAKNVKDLQGLQYVDIWTYLDENTAVETRMRTVSTGVFAAIDTGRAAIAGAKVAAKVMAKGGEKEEAVADAAVAFATSVNLANILDLVTVCRIDGKHIIEDIGSRLKPHTDTALIEYKTREIEKSTISEYTTLNKLETNILYSLELSMVERDIKSTKDANIQIQKDEWKGEWMEKCEESVGLKKLFEKDEEKVYAKINTRLGNEEDLSWLYRVLIELLRFEPYFQLDKDHKQKKLKAVDATYFTDVFCKKQSVISVKEVEELQKLYKKKYDYLEGKGEKTAASVAGAAVVTVAAAGAAFVFAPAIAVALVGGSFAGLSGAALTSASLAMLGGGAIAAGGLGMAGGAFVIAGGGALLGLGFSGLTATGLALLSSPRYIQTDYAKLLCNCEYVLIGLCKRRSEVSLIQKQVENDTAKLKAEITVVKEKENEDAEFRKKYSGLIKNLEKSVEIMERANEALKKLISKK